jgi:CBS domain containing-hemolysin-like protein
MSGQDTELFLLTISLMMSAFFSGSETAYTAAGRLAMEVYGRHRRPGAQAARFLYDRPRLLFSTTLVGNNLVGVAYSSLAALVLANLHIPIPWIVAISSIVVLLLGEILPKSIAREQPERWAMTSAWPLRVAYWLLYPVILIARGGSEVVFWFLRLRDDEGKAARISVNELRGIWHDLGLGGALDADEVELLDHAVTLRDKKIGELMVPRTGIAALPVGTPVPEAERLVTARGFSRLPVYEEDIDHIIGILHAKNLLFPPESLRDILLPALFVPEQTTVPRYLEMAREHESGLAVVVDEHGGTAGIITLEDVVEQIVGNIEDEHDRKSDQVRRVTGGSLLVHGLTTLDELEDKFGIKLPRGEYGTVGGLMIGQLDEIPKLGATIKAGKYSLRVVAADSHRVKRVLIRSASRLRQ